MALKKLMNGLRMNNFNLESISEEQKVIKRRILEISYESHLSHIGSCLSAVDLINGIYNIKRKDEKFVLSNGHAGIALYVILEKNKHIQKEEIKKLFIHPDRNEKLNIHVSTGSLGQGLPIAVGMAIANPKRKIYCMISDGECAEGSIWEALRIAKERKIHNLKVVVNYNGWAGYDETSSSLIDRFSGFGYEVKKINGHDAKSIDKALKSEPQGKPIIIFAITRSDQFLFLKGQDAHYHTMTRENYEEAMDLLKI